MSGPGELMHALGRREEIKHMSTRDLKEALRAKGISNLAMYSEKSELRDALLIKEGVDKTIAAAGASKQAASRKVAAAASPPRGARAPSPRDVSAPIRDRPAVAPARCPERVHVVKGRHPEMWDSDDESPPTRGPPARAGPRSLRLAFAGDTLGCQLALAPGRGVVVVTGVRDACEHAGTLRVGDELAAINGAPVPRPLEDAEFSGCMRRLKNAPRPLRLTFTRPATKPGLTRRETAPARSAARPSTARAR